MVRDLVERRGVFLYWLGLEVWELLDGIFYVLICEEHSFGYLADLDSSFPGVLNRKNSFIDYPNFMGIDIIFPG